MAEKKNIVIKLRFPKGQIPKEMAPVAPKMITEWNYKRIALALGGVVALGLAIHFFFTNRQQAQESIKPATAVTSVPSNALPNPSTATAIAPVTPQPPPVAVVTAPSVQPTPAQATATTDNNVVRAQLAPLIVDSEPVGEFSLPLKSSEKKPIPVNFFVELTNMKGKTVHHEWLLNGKLISQKTVNISDSKWRTASRQLIEYTTNSNWVVRLVDDGGKVLIEKTFTVVLAK
jgi:cytoskeletal protein RodZ